MCLRPVEIPCLWFFVRPTYRSSTLFPSPRDLEPFPWQSLSFAPHDQSVVRVVRIMLLPMRVGKYAPVVGANVLTIVLVLTVASTEAA